MRALHSREATNNVPQPNWLGLEQVLPAGRRRSFKSFDHYDVASQLTNVASSIPNGAVLFKHLQELDVANTRRDACMQLQTIRGWTGFR